MKKVISVLLSLIISISSESIIFAKNLNADDAWYEQYIEDISNVKELLNDESDMLTLESTITQAEFIYLAVNVLYKNTSNMNIEEANDYAKEKGYILDEEVTDNNKLLTRQMAAIIISRILKLEISENTNTSDIYDYITDWEMTCPKCKPYILSCYANGIMSGYPDGSFGGRYNATLTEVTAVLSRAWRLIHEI